MSTYFVEIVYNNKNKTAFNGTKFLRSVIRAYDVEHAKQKALEHYQPYYTGGDRGLFYVQCCWIINMPTREIIAKHWKSAAKSMMPMAISDQEGNTIGHRYFQPDKTKSEVLSCWDSCCSDWANPAVYYEPKKGGYVVAIHNHMSMSSEFRFFKGSTAEVYKKATQFVKDNTFRGDYFRKF